MVLRFQKVPGRELLSKLDPTLLSKKKVRVKKNKEKMSKVRVMSLKNSAAIE